ncbi:deoxyuridine triphosphatase [Cinnamomum micranthum f. kanehirae]|uniref:dUTP diphosphatase n=1 Tax=Cinnamomum micranthum f. kanehirae TaxID=337451 RepID=A0A443PSU0_9MAGN|nr:deoxyuridine triphosphatase [Cinnamomum micranthum f. kanehirae]
MLLFFSSVTPVPQYLTLPSATKMAVEGNAQTSSEVKEPSPRTQKLHGVSKDPLNLHSLRVKKLSENAVLPSRASPLSAGYDLFSATAVTVPAQGKALFPTDLSIGIPEGTYARIAPQFGLDWKHSTDVGAGVIDADYRGPVGVILFNNPDEAFEVKAGDRIAQLILQKIVTPDVLEVDDLDFTIRAALCSLLRVKKLSKNAILPSRATHLSAGYDLSSGIAVTVPARGKALVPMDLSIGIPEGTYARIAPRSGLAWKHSIHVGAGVIDADYRGPLGVILLNFSDKAFEVKASDRIAQLILEKIVTPDVLEVDDLDLTIRSSLLRVMKLSENAVLPSRPSPLSAGYNLSSAAAVTVPARGEALVPTDLNIGIPEGTCGRIELPLDFAVKNIHVGDGPDRVINADHRGPVGIILSNHLDEAFEVKVGDRIAQLILLEIVTPDVLKVDDLDSTARGAGGFGSTGV